MRVKVDKDAANQRFYDAVKAAGMEDRCGRENGITFHSFRHTYGTLMAATGAPIVNIQRWMGHSDIQTTMIYADHAPDQSGGREWVARAFSAADVPKDRAGTP